MRLRWHRLLFLLLFAVPLAIACGDEATIPSIVQLPDGSVDIDAGADAGSDDAGDDATPVCPPVAPNDALGVFVAPTGGNGGACGTRDAPCKTVGFGIARATALSRPRVFLARGVYVEKVELAAGVTVEGGWDVTGTTWSRTCSAPGDVVVLRAPLGDDITVVAKDLGNAASAAGLALLRVESKAAATIDAGESLYGVAAIGATTTLVLADVTIDVGGGGGGKNGGAGDAGDAGGSGCATPDDGGPGAPGSAGAGAGAGTFDPTGYLASAGAGGAGGLGGANGAGGPDGGCVQGGTCNVFPTCAFTPDPTLTCGTAGLPGCGGSGGALGAGGTGGGSSIGLFVWDATVQITGGIIRAGNGGNGGVGGTGGHGGDGGSGTSGTASAMVTTACGAPDAINLICAADTKGAGAGGGPGTAGGPGGAGGSGGGGAGGWSVAIYQGGAGIVQTSASTTLAHGKGGLGGGPDGGAGASGTAADRIP